MIKSVVCFTGASIRCSAAAVLTVFVANRFTIVTLECVSWVTETFVRSHASAMFAFITDRLALAFNQISISWITDTLIRAFTGAIFAGLTHGFAFELADFLIAIEARTCVNVRAVAEGAILGALGFAHETWVRGVVVFIGGTHGGAVGSVEGGEGRVTGDDVGNTLGIAVDPAFATG